MMSTTIPAVYENGTFRLLEQPSDLREQQRVQLFYVAFDDTLYPALPSVEERVRFVHQTAGIWHVEDDELRRWVAEEVSLFDDGD